MGLEVSPQGIMFALIVAAVAMMAYVNRDSLKGLFPPNKGETKSSRETITLEPLAKTVGETVAEKANVLDVMKLLSALNVSDDLKIGRQISEIYAILTQQTNVFERELDVLDLLKAITNATQEKGIDCHDELKEIYSKIVDHEPEEKPLRR